MPLQSFLAIETLVALGTCKGFLPNIMHSVMIVQMRDLNERFVAYFTGEVALPRVDQPVARQCRLGAESLVANVAHELLLAVFLGVRVEVLFLRKAVAACLASKGFVPRMQALVTSQCILAVERPVTHITAKAVRRV